MNNPFRRWHTFETRIIRVAASDATDDAKKCSEIVCVGQDDEKQINKALAEVNNPNSKLSFVELSKRREWRWPWQAKKMVTILEAGTVILSEGTFHINKTINLDKAHIVGI